MEELEIRQMEEGDVDAVAAIYLYYAQQGRFADRIFGIEGILTADNLREWYTRVVLDPASPLSVRVGVGHARSEDGREISRVVGFYAVLPHPEIDTIELLLLAIKPRLPKNWRVLDGLSVGKRLFREMLASSRILAGRRGVLVARTNLRVHVPSEAQALLRRANFKEIGPARNLAVHARPSSDGLMGWIWFFCRRKRVLQHFQSSNARRA